ncbi:6-pyruvoyl-tetrahydropterin synthase-related protein [Patescibacteria group bacterium]
MGLKKHLWVLLPLIFLGLFAMKTFIGSAYFDGHDSQAHIVRLYQYDLALKDGQVPPRWAGDLLAGYGYPVFIFAYPLPYIISEAFHLLGASLAVSIKLTTVLGYLFSIITMYFFATAYWQSKKAGFLSAILWGYAPYIFVKIFITGSLGVVTSYAFIPLFFLLLHRLTQKPNLKNSVYLSLATASWVLSHLITPIIFSPLIVLFIVFHSKKKTFKQTFSYLFLSGLITLGLIAWFILPALLELQYTHFADFVTHAYTDNFVSFKRLLYSKWGTGAPGWSDNPLSQQVGIAQWLTIALAIVFALRQTSKKLYPFLITFFLSIFLMLKISQPVWDFFPLLPIVHIPWRFLSLTVFTAAISAGFLITVSKKPLIKNLLLLFLITLALYANRNHLRINEKIVYSQEFFDKYTGVATGWNEHLPIWVKKMPEDFPQEKLEVINGQCNTASLVNQSNLQSFTLDCQRDSTFQLNTAYYPGWQMIINDQDITNQVKQNLSQSNGMIQFSTESGNHQLTAQFKDTPLRQATQIISFFSFLGVIYLLLKRV